MKIMTFGTFGDMLNRRSGLSSTALALDSTASSARFNASVASPIGGNADAGVLQADTVNLRFSAAIDNKAPLTARLLDVARGKEDASDIREGESYIPFLEKIDAVLAKYPPEYNQRLRERGITEFAVVPDMSWAVDPNYSAPWVTEPKIKEELETWPKGSTVKTLTSLFAGALHRPPVYIARHYWPPKPDDTPGEERKYTDNENIWPRPVAYAYARAFIEGTLERPIRNGLIAMAKLDVENFYKNPPETLGEKDIMALHYYGLKTPTEMGDDCNNAPVVRGQISIGDDSNAFKIAAELLVHTVLEPDLPNPSIITRIFPNTASFLMDGLLPLTNATPDS